MTESKKKWLLLFLAFAAAATLGAFLSLPVAAPGFDETGSETAGLTAAQQTALRERIENTVRERGMLESADPLTIRSPLSAASTVVFLVRDGSTVKQGQLLLQLDSTALEEKLKRLQIEELTARAAVLRAEAATDARAAEQAAEVKAARLALQAADLAHTAYEAKDGERQLERQIAEGEVSAAESKTKAAATVVKHLEANAGSTAELARARAELHTARQEVAVATAQKRLLVTYRQKRQAAEFAAEAAKRKADLIRVENETAAEKTKAKAELAAREAELAAVAQRIKQLEKQIGHCRIPAPRDGVVFHAPQSSRRAEPSAIEEGATVRPRQQLLQMPDMKKLQVRVRVHETRIPRVRVGQSVTLRFDASPDKPLRGTVKSVSRFPKRGDWPNNDLTLFDVIVSVKDPSPAIKIGMSALAEIDVSAKR